MAQSAGNGCQLRAHSTRHVEFGYPSRQEPPLGLLAGERERPFVRRAGLDHPAQPPAEIGPGGVREPIVGQVAPGENGIDQYEAGRLGGVTVREAETAPGGNPELLQYHYE